MTTLYAPGDFIDLAVPFLSIIEQTAAITQSRELAEAVKEADFVRVAREYRLIDQSAIQVLVPYCPFVDLFEELRQQQAGGISGKWMRAAQGLTVSIFRPRQDHPAWESLIPAKLRYGKGESDEWFILEDRNGEFYDEVFGLRLPQAQQIFILIIPTLPRGNAAGDAPASRLDHPSGRGQPNSADLDYTNQAVQKRGKIILFLSEEVLWQSRLAFQL